MPGNPDDLRRTYVAFCSGAGLSHADVKSLLADRGYTLSNNAVREFGRANRFRDERPRTQARGSMITIEILRDLISAWADEQREKRILDERTSLGDGFDIPRASRDEPL